MALDANKTPTASKNENLFEESIFGVDMVCRDIEDKRLNPALPR